MIMKKDIAKFKALAAKFAVDLANAQKDFLDSYKQLQDFINTKKMKVIKASLAKSKQK